jgi:hypothetical protein
MKLKIYIITTLFILLSATFSQSVYAQVAKKQAKVLTQDEIDKREVEKFVDLFVKQYSETLDLTKVPSDFFVNDFKTQIIFPFFIRDYDSSLADDEKFQNGVLMIDFFSALLLSELKKVNYDVKRLEKIFSDDFIEKKLDNLFKNHTKAKIFLHRENFNQIKNVTEFRTAITDFIEVINNLRKSALNNNLLRETRKAKILNAKKAKLFTLEKIRECSDDECGEFPKGTKLAEIDAVIFHIILVKDKQNWKVMNIIPVGD